MTPFEWRPWPELYRIVNIFGVAYPPRWDLRGMYRTPKALRHVSEIQMSLDEGHTWHPIEIVRRPYSDIGDLHQAGFLTMAYADAIYAYRKIGENWEPFDSDGSRR